MELRVRARLSKDVRAAANGRQVSLQRLAEARRQKIEVPSLEEAMRNVRLGEGEGGKAEKHRGETGQAEVKRERRGETREEKAAGEKVKRARAQSI